MPPHTRGEATRPAGASDARVTRPAGSRCPPGPPGRTRHTDGTGPDGSRTYDGRRADRGVSDVVAVAILVGMVVVAAVLVAATGGQVIDDTRDRSEAAAAAVTLQELDSRVASLAPGGSNERIHLATGTDGPGRFRVVRDGSITVGIDDGTCSATVPLTSVRYSTTGGTTLTYEAGAIWRTDGGGTTSIDPPDLRYRNRTIGISVANLSGRIASSRVRATLLPSSRADTRSIERDLFASLECDRPDSVTVAVRSDRYRAWGRYMADEFGLDVGRGVRLDASNRTAEATVPPEMLPPEADDDRNQVVDFEGGYGRERGGAFTVSKGSPALVYPVSVTLLGGDGQDGRPTVTVSRDRRPLDVVLVIDESRSMAGGKLEDTRDAATGLVDRLNESAGDRVGVVGYSDVRCLPFFCPPGYLEDARVHAPLSDDHDAAVESVEEDLWAGGWTPIAAGIDEATDEFVSTGGDSNERVAVLLSDGQHNGPGDVIEAAERAAARNVTIYAVGFGEDADVKNLTAIANATGGRYYHADDAGELRDHFRDIAVEITRTRTVRTTPITVRAGSATFLPEGGVEAVEPNGTAHNLNDPGLRFPVAYSTELPDGGWLPLTLTYWDCARWKVTNETVTAPDGKAYWKSRCAKAGAESASINATSASDRVRAFTAANTTADLPDGTGSWVESNVTAILRANGLVTPSGDLSLRSNQVLLVYDLPGEPAGAGDYNDEVVLVEVGYASEEVRVRYAVDVGVRNVRLGAGP